MNASEWSIWGACMAGAYLVGSIPVGFLMARAKGIDIRAHGSGTIGATNVSRVLGRRAGRICFVLDMLKGLLPTLAVGLASELVWHWSQLGIVAVLQWMAIAAASVAGHMYSPWLGFKGGKGVSTGFGALLGIFPVMSAAAVGALLVWLPAVRITRQVGISSCIAALSLPAWVYGFMFVAARSGLFVADHHTGRVPLPGSTSAYAAAAAGLSAIVIWKHRGNIARTFAGTERRIGEAADPRPSSGGDKAGSS